MLTNARVLVVEDQILIAMEIEAVLLAAGAGRVEIARTVGEALRRPELLSGLDLAIVEARLGDPDVMAFCATLAAAGVAVIVSSADSAASQHFPGAVFLEKPFFSESLLAAYAAARQP